ncbi:chloride channel protein [Acidithiobacillus sp. AMEEHan]|uniref:chloride channel protein n=1 Tax=Acidithiobacillus sp. AMEEHan TaxID=2994951 RepID=UPI0027E3D978|nr:chloride channel protein [Acidithiobacillus sp. AMEEHan]
MSELAVESTVAPMVEGSSSDTAALRSRWRKLRRNPFFHFLLAIFVGVIAGLGAVVFRRLIALMHNLFFYGHASLVFSALQHAKASTWGAGIILAPIVGGLIVVWLVRSFAPEAKGHGVPEVMDAIYYRAGVIRPVVVIVKALASAITIGSGGSVGREGPIIQIGAAFGSSLSAWLHLPEWQRLGLIAAGAGAGIAATFNTPVGGVLFAVELMLVEISARTLVPVMIATGTATLVSRLLLGNFPSFIIPPDIIAETAHMDIRNYLVFVLLGIIVGGIGLFFTRMLYWTEDFFEHMLPNAYLRAVVGMGAVGITIWVLFLFSGKYYVEGVGYATIQDVLDGVLLNPGFLLLLVLLKILSFSTTLAAGGSGGVFSPSLFVGALVGAACILLCNSLFPGLGAHIATGAALGMAGMVASSTGAAVTGAVMIFEMTNDYHIIVPLILVASIAYGIRRMVTRESIYTLKLLRRGHYIPEARHSNLYLMRSASSLVETPLLRLHDHRLLSDLRRLLRRYPRLPHILLVRDGKPVAAIASHRVREILGRRNLPEDTPLLELASTDWILLRRDVQLYELVAAFRSSGAEIALLSEDGEPPQHHSSVSAMVTSEDILSDTSLPVLLLHPEMKP